MAQTTPQVVGFTHAGCRESNLALCIKCRKAYMPEIAHLVRIKATPTDVFEKLNTVKGLSRWWTPETSGSAKVGDELTFQFGPEYYKLLTVIKSDKPKLVEWKCNQAVEEWIGTTIHMHLETYEDGTLLRFKHLGWKSHSDLLSQCSYDWALFLRSLKKLCEKGIGQPYPNQAEF